jgi:hypothetical protein|tara:strand:- start:376 stop:591 length:216 start_codon:yes stop_codon:yes gene_type:complete
MKVAVHNHLHPDQKIQIIDRIEIKPEMVAAQGHQCKTAPCYDIEDQKSASLIALEKQAVDEYKKRQSLKTT